MATLPPPVNRELKPLRRSPQRTAILLDVDGTLAPIVSRPELAAVPAETQELVRNLVSRYLVVACISGRAGDEVRRLVSVDGVRYVGNHGIELHPEAGSAAGEIARFRRELESVWPVEDKTFSLSLHYREASDEAAARAELTKIANRARARGLDPRWGRKVLEIRPSHHADKGTAVGTIIDEAGARLALYAGDDTTDIGAFEALARHDLDAAVRVAVSSDEVSRELIARADLVVEGPDGLRPLLEALCEAA